MVANILVLKVSLWCILKFLSLATESSRPWRKTGLRGRCEATPEARRRGRPDLLIQLPRLPRALGPRNRQAWRGEGSCEARQRTEPGRAPRPRRTGGSGSRPEQKDTGGGTISASYQVQARRGERSCSRTGCGEGPGLLVGLASLLPLVCDTEGGARPQLPGAGLGRARCRSSTRDTAPTAHSGAIPRLGAGAFPQTLLAAATASERGGRRSLDFLGEAGRRRGSLLLSRQTFRLHRSGEEGPTMDRDGPDAARQDAEREHGRYLSRRAVAQEQLAQIKEHKDQADLAKQEKKREGEQIQRSHHLYQLEIQREKEKEQDKKVECQRLHHEYVAEQKIFKAEEKQKEDKDDDRIKAYIKGKEMMADLTREKHAETNRMIQKHKDKALEQLTAQMNEAFKVEDDRLARGAAEVEVEYQMKNKEKERKKKAAIESIEEHRATVMKMKEENERQEKEEGEKDRNQWMTEDGIYLEMEKAKKQRQRDANMEVQKIQIQQMAEKQARKEQAKQAELDYDAQREAAFHQDRACRR
ncbi:uncharacterized protein ACIQIH_009784 [Cyanocitta cristata]